MSVLTVLPRRLRAGLLLLVGLAALGACTPPALTGAPAVNPVASASAPAAAAPTVPTGGGFALEGPSPRSIYTVHFVTGTSAAVRTETVSVLGRLTTLTGIRFPVDADVPARLYADPGELIVGSGLTCHQADEGGCTTIFGTPTEITGAVVTVAPTTPSGDLRPTLLHELGHAVGLAHWSGAPAQVMNPALQSFTDYQAGDRNGLATLRAMVLPG